jgi:prepilin-type N-terminal cleavage/methylation domain-containing protein
MQVQRRKGYTLMELICVLAIIAIIAGLAYPTISTMFGNYVLRAASDKVRAGWVRARAHAIEEGQRYRFAVVPGKGNFRIAPDSPEYWSGSMPAFDPANPPVVIDDALPNPVRFTLGAGPAPNEDGDSSDPVGSIDPGKWVSVVFFEADGSAESALPSASTNEDVEITFNSNGFRPLVMHLRAMTGIASVKMKPVDGQR